MSPFKVNASEHRGYDYCRGTRESRINPRLRTVSEAGGLLTHSVWDTQSGRAPIPQRLRVEQRRLGRLPFPHHCYRILSQLTIHFLCVRTSGRVGFTGATGGLPSGGRRGRCRPAKTAALPPYEQMARLLSPCPLTRAGFSHVPTRFHRPAFPSVWFTREHEERVQWKGARCRGGGGQQGVQLTSTRPLAAGIVMRLPCSLSCRIPEGGDAVDGGLPDRPNRGRQGTHEKGHSSRTLLTRA
ncbi:hypothetical protein LZ31DRAFT_556767 [Colletotrichum somersetense]|nr:hypothetical protein LZ31DRAFT_556767 [Colletotrichum somersetense]